MAVSLSASLTLYGRYQLVFGGYLAKPTIPKAQTNTTRHGKEAVEFSTPPAKVLHNFDPSEDVIALVAVDQSETIVTVEEDGKDAVIFIGNSALARVVGAAKILTPEHVTFMPSEVVDILNADTQS